VARTLVALRGQGEPVAIAELARALLASPRTPAPAVARRVVAAALNRPVEGLPERLGPEALAPAPAAPLGADTPLARAEFHVVDLETTGLGHDCEILEIGAVHLAAGRRVSHFFSLVRPSGRIPAKITALTGIDERMVRDAPRASECLARFRAWLDRAPEAPFVAHNAPFDAGFVGRAFARQGLRPLSTPQVCTRKLARRAVPTLPRFDLDRLCAHFGIDNGARHRATGDAVATAELLLRLLERARREHGIATLGDLHRLLARRPPARKRPPGARRVRARF
jgi:DNA polymerase III epsilon subunit family exonuclease